ncbi:MAG: hypothetical protein CML02_13810 [Pseudooceanicola sp.]|nr:hypothetical protein [Pseudooceanicola sp.]
MPRFASFTARLMLVATLALWGAVGGAQAQTVDPFEHGWTLDTEASDLRFLSIKKGDLAETSRFATLSGLITDSGKAQIRVLLDSVDTTIDLRNVRMRFLFFETFNNPEATITVDLNPDDLRDLHSTRRKMVRLGYTLNLHGVTYEDTADVAVTLMSNDRVNVSSTTPIALKLSDFNLEGGREKLQEAANVTIVPLGIVSFDFVFDRSAPGTPPVASVVQAAVTPGSAALETKGVMDREACVGRFEILSRTGNINFAPASARLSSDSTPLLDNLYDIVNRCPDLSIEIGGHTDSDGSDQANQSLSERRAAAVGDYLRGKGIPPSRMRAVGYGESKPVRPNDTRENKARNRRIEFTVLN